MAPMNVRKLGKGDNNLDIEKEYKSVLLLTLTEKKMENVFYSEKREGIVEDLTL